MPKMWPVLQSAQTEMAAARSQHTEPRSMREDCSFASDRRAPFIYRPTHEKDVRPSFGMKFTRIRYGSLS